MGILKERLLARTAALSERRYPELLLKEKDPIKWEILYTRLAGLVHNSAEAAKRVTASPVVREAGEFIFSLMTPEGESVCYSSGLLVHNASLVETVKSMLTFDYEEEPGIRHGDIFFNNDAHLGGAHPQDQAIVIPIFHEGVLAGWAGGLTHVPETGSPEPGGNVPSTQTRYAEGLVLPLMKIGENDRVRKDFDLMVERDTRVATWWLLDNRAKMAGTKLIRDGLIALLREYGSDYYLGAIYEYIEDSRQACQRKARQVLFPGRYQDVVFFDLPYATLNFPIKWPIDFEIRLNIEMNVSPDGTVTLDADGSSPAQLHPFNCTTISARGAMASTAMQTVFYDVKPNQGINQAIADPGRYNLPPGTANPGREFSTGMWGNALFLSGCFLTASGRACYVMGYREEANGQLGVPSRILAAGPKDQYGRPWVVNVFEYGGTGLSATAVHDGLDIGAIQINPETDIGDVEVWEKIMPLMWLGRGVVPDSGGHGKYRGGNGLFSLYWVALADTAEIGTTGSFDFIFSHGTSGGYPAGALYHHFWQKTDLKQLIEGKKPLIHKEGDLEDSAWKDAVKGDYETGASLSLLKPMKKYDMWYQFTGGGQGYGDPIERDPALVKKDLDLGLTTRRTSEAVYGVAIDSSTGQVDEEKTKKLRDDIRRKRRSRWMPTAKYVESQRQKVMSGELPDVPKSCLNGCLGNSQKFLKEFREAWDLPEDFVEIPSVTAK